MCHNYTPTLMGEVWDDSSRLMVKAWDGKVCEGEAKGFTALGPKAIDPHCERLYYMTSHRE